MRGQVGHVSLPRLVIADTACVTPRDKRPKGVERQFPTFSSQPFSIAVSQSACNSGRAALARSEAGTTEGWVLIAANPA